MERTEFMVMCGECLSAEECMAKFDRTKDSLMEGTAIWNQSLEVAYNEFSLDDEDYEDNHVACYQNMPCDTTGMCGGTSCPQFFQCHS